MNKSRKIAFAGLLGALALVFAYVEGMFPPLPMMPPGAKPGLSNILTMLAAGTMGLPYAIFIVLIKGTFALLTRGAIAGAMSLAGGILSAVAAWIILSKTKTSFVTTGIICAVFHNIGQLIVAYFLTSTGILYYIPALLFFGICSGTATGLLLKLVYGRTDKIIKKINRGGRKV